MRFWARFFGNKTDRPKAADIQPVKPPDLQVNDTIEEEARSLLRELEADDIGATYNIQRVEGIEARLEDLGARAVPTLVLALTSPFTFVRISAVRVLGNIADPRAVPDLLQMLSTEQQQSEPNEHVVRALAIALGKIGDPRAASLLSSRSWGRWVEESVREALQKLRDNPGLVRSLKDKDTPWGYRSGCARYLAKNGWRPQTAEEKLLFHIGNEHLEEVVAIGLPAVPQLTQVVKENNPDSIYSLRTFAAEALGRIGSPEAVRGLLAGMAGDDHDRKFNRFVATMLQRLNWSPETIDESILFAKRTDSGWNRLVSFGPEAIPALIDALQEALQDNKAYTPAYRLIAVLGAVGDMRSVPILLEALKDFYHKSAALAALQKLGWTPQTVDEKLTYFKAEGNCNALAELGSVAIPALVTLMNSDIDYSYSVPDALARIGDRKAVPNLLARVKDKSSYFKARIAAMRALGRIGDAAIVEDILELHRNEEEDRIVREACIEALEEIGDAAVPALRSILKDANTAWQEAARSALKRLGQSDGP